jgi:hypothetical protein
MERDGPRGIAGSQSYVLPTAGIKVGRGLKRACAFLCMQACFEI